MLLLPFPSEHPNHPLGSFSFLSGLSSIGMKQMTNPWSRNLPACVAAESRARCSGILHCSRHDSVFMESQLIRKCSVFISMVCAECDLCVFILAALLYQGTVNILVFLFACFYCLWASEHYWWDITDQLELMIFFCCVILLLKPCKQRANTSGTRVNTLVCIWMGISMDSYSQHLCKCKLIHVKGCGKGNKKTEAKWEAGFMEMLVFHYLSCSLHLFYCTGFQKWPTPYARVFLV